MIILYFITFLRLTLLLLLTAIFFESDDEFSSKPDPKYKNLTLMTLWYTYSQLTNTQTDRRLGYLKSILRSVSRV